MISKLCPECRIEKEVENFYLRKAGGYESHCKACKKSALRKRKSLAKVAKLAAHRKPKNFEEFPNPFPKSEFDCLVDFFLTLKRWRDIGGVK